jgi:hypothetical protein
MSRIVLIGCIAAIASIVGFLAHLLGLPLLPSIVVGALVGGAGEAVMGRVHVGTVVQ